MKSWITAGATALALAFALVATTGKVASAQPGLFCRDCPFPAKIADGRWIMPNGKIRVDIDKNPFDRSRTQIDVTLRAADSGAVIARGSIIQAKNRKTVFVDLLDTHGREIRGFVRYLDADGNNIQAKFSCESCSISPMLD